ncbi:MAG: Uma2 family endonuclease [Cyanobacteria bacterium P01_F01_bin.42]
MSQLKTQPRLNAWVPIGWEDYLTHINASENSQAKGYYHLGCMRLEMLPIGFDHSTAHSLISLAINLFGITNSLPLTIADSCTYRKTDIRDCQPDLSVYVGANVTAIPKQKNIVNLNQYPSPNLAIEISKTTLLDDLGAKRSLYESLNISEYWVVDVAKNEVIAYTMSLTGSHQIQTSNVLPGLALSTLETALTQSQTQDQTAIASWLMREFQPSGN